MARLMLLMGNAVALLGAWLAGLDIGDVLVVLAFELIVSLYLLGPLVAAHRNASRLRGHFELTTVSDGTQHASNLTYGPTHKLGHALVVLVGLFAGIGWASGHYLPATHLPSILGLSLAVSIVGWLVERAGVAKQPFSWLRTQVRAVGVRLAGLIIVVPLGILLSDLGLVCVIIMVVVKTGVEHGLLTILDQILSGQGAQLGAGMSSKSQRELEQLSQDAYAHNLSAEDTLDEATFQRLLKEARGNQGIA